MRQTSLRCTVSPLSIKQSPPDDALSYSVVVHHDPNIYMYHQLGEILHARGDDDDAQDILKQGLTEANRLGEPKAAHELQALLDMI